MGECILNLSKLVPFQGHIIEQVQTSIQECVSGTHSDTHVPTDQDFDVKQGRQYKGEIPSKGKLMLQIEFTSGPPMAEGAPLPAATTSYNSAPVVVAPVPPPAAGARPKR
jgi:hypothetical protein